MTLHPGFPAVSNAATFLDLRRAIESEVAHDAAGNIRAGIYPWDANPLLSATSDSGPMTVAVGPFIAALSRLGLVRVRSVGTEKVSISAAPGSGSRWSVVYLKQRESGSPMSDGADGPVLDKVESTVSLTQARSALPAGALELGYVQVPASRTTTASDGVVVVTTVPYTAPIGGTVWVRNATELAAWTPADGSRAWQIDTGIGHTRKGGAWVPDDTGDVALTLNGGWAPASGSPTPSYRIRNGMVTLNGRLDTSSGATTTGFQLPLPARPSTERVLSVQIGAGNAMQAVVIQTGGNVVFFNMSIPTSDYRLASIPPWPVA